MRKALPVIAGILLIVAVITATRCWHRSVNVGKTPDLENIRRPPGEIAPPPKPIIGKRSKQKKILWSPSAEEIATAEQTEALFFGKVVDQFGEAVPNVEISYSPTYQKKEGLSESWLTRAGPNGMFSIRKANAPSLRISVELPDGYYSTGQGHGTFGFAEIPASMPPELRAPPHRADPNNPVIFTLKKMGRTEPLIHRSQSGVVKSEQSYLIGTSDAHWLTLKYWFDPELKRIADVTERPIYDWGVEIAVPGGGLLERAEPQSLEPESFIAPVGGYSPSVRVAFIGAMDDKQHRSEVRREFFVRFSDGTFARVEVAVRSEPKRPFGVVESWFNPSGRPFTEFDASKSIPVQPGK